MRFVLHTRRTLRLVARRWPDSAPTVLAVTTPPCLPNVVARYARRYGMPYAILVYDTYPDHIVEAGILAPTNPAIRFWRTLNARMYQDAAEIITIGDAMATHLRAQLSAQSADRVIHVIPIGADTAFFRPVEKSDSPFAIEQGLQDKFVIMYSGNMSPTHRLETLAQLADELRHMEELHFLFVGAGLAREKIRREFRTRNISNVTFLGYQPWERLPEVFATADLAAVSQAPGTEHLSSPSKVFPLLSSGTAILALTHEASDLGRLIQGWQAGLVFPHEDVVPMARAVEGLMADANGMARLQGNALAAGRNFSLEMVGARIGEALLPHVESPAAQ